jgi:pyruvate-ferredoxin/flavodoxin oxidoreductase
LIRATGRRYDPRRTEESLPALVLDSPAPKIGLDKYIRGEGRYRMVEQAMPDRFKALMEQAQLDVKARQALYEELASKKA